MTRTVCTVSTAILLSTAYANAQSACKSPFFTRTPLAIEQMCSNSGVTFDMQGSTDTLFCGSDSAEWKTAKKNIDWVWFEDSGAKNSYLAAQAEFRDSNCLPPSAESTRALHAVLYAQRHNLNAQCSIYRCSIDFWGTNSADNIGYYFKIKNAGKLPQ
jgi:hypothetical protein